MDMLKRVFKDSIYEAYKTTAEYQVYIGSQRVGIKIREALDGHYTYSLSHHYKGSRMAGSFTSSRTIFDTPDQALDGARSEMLSFYDSTDTGAEWIESECF